MLAICALMLSFVSKAQNIISYKVKTPQNASTRTLILDAIRDDLRKSERQEFVFVVDKLNLYNGYAWFAGSVQRKDGKPVNYNTDWADCCHVEALLAKRGSKWVVIDIGVFSTDVWYDGIWNKWKLPKSMF